jgi:serine/threonine protein kinase
MVSTDLGACEWFVWDLRRSNLLDRGQLDQIVGEFLEKNPGAEPPALAEYLVRQSILTQFQADRVLQGKTQGFVLGPFTLQDALGTGSMGTVYKAQSKTDNQWYAVKVLPRRSMWNVRIARRKVRLFEQCQHPAVVPFVDVGTSGGMHYLAWPLVEGQTLDKLVEQKGKLEPRVAAGYALQAAEGLKVCHAQNLFHGTIKPSNLMIGTDGNMRVLDFGIGSLLAETEGESLVDTMSTANSVASGLDCASPESVMDPTNLTTIGDQYSLGCVLYYCLSGRYPFPEGTAAEKMTAHQFKQPTPLRELAPEVPEQLAAVVERLMGKQPQMRYPNIADVIADLAPLAAGSGLSAGQSPAAATVQARPKTPPPVEELPPPRGSEFNLLLPSRESMRGGRSPTPIITPLRSPTPVIALPTRASLASDSPARPEQERKLSRQALKTRQFEPTRSLDERLGTVGMFIIAMLMCAAAWFVSARFFLK